LGNRSRRQTWGRGSKAHRIGGGTIRSREFNCSIHCCPPESSQVLIHPVLPVAHSDGAAASTPKSQAHCGPCTRTLGKRVRELFFVAVAGWTSVSFRHLQAISRCVISGNIFAASCNLPLLVYVMTNLIVCDYPMIMAASFLSSFVIML